jgi:hypothetical protein
MNDLRRLAAEAAAAGTAASVLSAALLALAGRRQTPSAAAPLNAVSQWYWGQPDALAADQPDLRHTALGYATHHGASIFWGALHAWAFGSRRELDRPGPALAAAAVTATVAAVVDLKLTPERFTPGFQHRISTPALVGTYAVFGVGLAVGSLAARRLLRARRRMSDRSAEPGTPDVPDGAV